MNQQHLNYIDTVNLGSYYTPEWIVDVVYELLSINIGDISQFKILDTSCGYGSFLRGNNAIGADIDELAIARARTINPNINYYIQNSLLSIDRSNYALNNKDKLIIVGNPPYNDTTSLIRNSIKKEVFQRDADIVSRDLGISFLLSYSKLYPDYICVLHPLSYLIKKSNFVALKSFRNNYKLKDSIIISSKVFSNTSKSTFFPIIIAFYERDFFGMDYNYISNYQFKTFEGSVFSINDFDTIDKYISKYPNKNYVEEKNTVAHFWTMRDINALKRTQTFVKKENSNTIRVIEEVLPYYCYVDVFKEYLPNIPYYFGNCDIMIDNEEFMNIQDSFVTVSSNKHPEFKEFIKYDADLEHSKEVIAKYFKKLLGKHYVDK